MSRTVRKQLWLDDAEKEVLRKMMRRQAAFTGVEVLSYCMMGNHFHLLLRVPERPLKADGQHLVSDAELLRRYEAFYGDRRPRSTYSLEELKAAFAEGGKTAEHARRTVLARMGDLSAFMKELKQRFGIWFNDRHENLGTIWSDRFKSVVVEDLPEVVSAVSAYIDLNPVRAGMVDDPKDYIWSHFGALMHGSEICREGLIAVYQGRVGGYRDTFAAYRMLLYTKGSRTKSGEVSPGGKIDPKIAEAVLAAGGKLSVAEVLRLRIGDFSESVVVGGASFVEGCAEHWGLAKRFGKKRWSGWQRFCGRTDEDPLDTSDS